jgi:hypothetical protein
MPENNFLFVAEWQNVKGVNFKAEIIPPGNDDLVAPTIVPVPASVVLDFGTLVYEYDKLFVGMPITPTCNLKPNLVEMRYTANLRLLYSFVTMQSDSVVFLRTPSGWATGGGEIIGEVRVGPLWVLYTDFGRRDQPNPLRADGMYVIYSGVQRPLPSTKGEIKNPFTYSVMAEEEITLVHSTRAALEAVTPAFLTAWFTKRNEFEGPFGLFFDIAYEESDWFYFVAQGLPVGTASATFIRELAKCIKLRDIFGAVEELARQVWRGMLRQGDVGGLPTSFTFTSPAHGTNGGTPLDNWTFHEQNMNNGGAEPGDVLPLDDLYVRAFVYPSDKTGNPDEYIAGLLHDDGSGDQQQSLYRFTNCWDYISKTAEAYYSKGQIIQAAAPNIVQIHFNKVRANAAGPHSIDPTVIGGTSIPYEGRGRILKGASVAVPGMEGDDLSEVPASWYRGLDAEEIRPVKGLFHNLPKVGDTSQLYLSYSAGTGPTALSKNVRPEVTSRTPGYRAIIHNNFSMWEVYYLRRIARPPGKGGFNTTEVVPIRVHSEMELDDGDAITLSIGDRFSWWTWGGGDAEDQLKAWWESMKIDIRATQQFACLAYATAFYFASRWSNTGQVVYDGWMFPMQFGFHPSSLGELYAVGDTGDCGVFLPATIRTAANMLAHLRTDNCGLVRWECDINAGDIKASFINLPGILVP